MSIARSPRRSRVLGAAVFASVAAFAGAASAGPRPSGPARMPIGAVAAAPAGFLDFCERSPGECVASNERVNFAEMRARANSLYWAGVFGQPQPAQVTRPAATASTGGFDWSRVFPQRAAVVAPPAVADPMRAGVAVAMEDVASPAVDSSAVQRVETAEADSGAASAEDFGRDVAARVRDFGRPLTRQAPKPAPFVAPVISMSAQDWKTVRNINRDVNRQIRSGSDTRVYGRDDYWAVPNGANARGDCEDYVLAKRQALVRAGYPTGALSIAVVETRWGEVHAVLLVATDEGDFVLDNLTGRISRWDQVSYRWRERQAPGKTFEWVRMAG